MGIIKNIASVPAVSAISVPCGTSFASVRLASLPSSLVVTMDDASTITCPITWEFGSYNPWDNVGRTLTVKGVIAFPIQDASGNKYKNPNDVMATCAITTTALNGLGSPSAGTIVPGSAYISAIYNSVPLTGGAGVNATAKITVTAGAVTAVKILTGSNYKVGDVLTTPNTNLGGAGSGFTFTITQLDNGTHGKGVTSQTKNVFCNYPGVETGPGNF